VDTQGNLLFAVITPADIQDRDVIPALMREAKKLFPTLEAVIADGGYSGEATKKLVEVACGLPRQIVKRSDKAKGFVLLPKRWIVERTFGWLGRCRRLSKDYECLNRMSMAFLVMAMIRRMVRLMVRLGKI
jgi:transposase